MDLKKILANLKSKKKAVREKAVDNLALAQDANTVKQLEEVLLNDSERSVRRRAAVALGRIEDEDAIEALNRAIETDSDVETRRNAAIALGQFGDERAIMPLFEFYSETKSKNFFENLDRARVNLVLTQLTQKKGFTTIEDMVEWKKKKE